MDKGMYGRKDRLIQQKRHDTYQESGKYTEPTVCSECGSVYCNGHWTWKTRPPKAMPSMCPACRRIADHYPAGLLEIRGVFAEQQKTEIFNLIRNIEKKEKKDRPLERIMTIDHQSRLTFITTTGIHLARRIGDALSRSYHGSLSYHYSEGDKTIRVYWELN